MSFQNLQLNVGKIFLYAIKKLNFHHLISLLNFVWLLNCNIIFEFNNMFYISSCSMWYSGKRLARTMPVANVFKLTICQSNGITALNEIQNIVKNLWKCFVSVVKTKYFLFKKKPCTYWCMLQWVFHFNISNLNKISNPASIIYIL